MHARIESIVRDQLARSPSATIEARQRVYDNIRSLLPAVVDTSEAGVDRLRLALALDEVIARIEAEHGSAPRSRIERGIGKTVSWANAFKVKYGAAALLASTAFDFLKPIAELMVPTLLLSAAAGATLFALRTKAGSYRGAMQRGAAFCAMLLVCNLAWLGLQSMVPGARTNGALAQLVPAAGTAQDLVAASLILIEQQTRQSAEGIARIETTLSGVKRETSANPRKELANRGVLWAAPHFIEAWRQNDEDTLRLFFEGSFNWTKGFAVNDDFLAMMAATRNQRIVDMFTADPAFGPAFCEKIDDLGQPARTIGRLVDTACILTNWDQWATVATRIGGAKVTALCGPATRQRLEFCKGSLDKLARRSRERFCHSISEAECAARLSEQEQIAFGSQRDTDASNYLYARERSAALSSAIDGLP